MRYVLTAICMATKWPEAVPLRSVTANAVAQGLTEIFSRTALPHAILSDQGAQFMGRVLKQLCASWGVTQIRTTAYHPQTNGMVEHMHGTLESMLTKAHSRGLDWSMQLPFALFALRQMPNRDSHLSPYELVFSWAVRTPLELIYEDWVGRTPVPMDVCSWVEQVQERVELAREVARQRLEKAVVSRKKEYDKKSAVRELGTGDLVWARIPGLDHKLREAWLGPWEVVEQVGRVNYRVKQLEGGSKVKVVHINTLKAYVERDAYVRRLTIVAESGEGDAELTGKLVGQRSQYVEGEIEAILHEFSDVMQAKPGCTKMTVMEMDVGGARPIAQARLRR